MTKDHRVRLTEAEVRRTQPPESGNRIFYDGEVPGFGCRVTAAGARSFVLNYSSRGRERRLTIGSWPAWSVVAARAKAKELRRQIDGGADPLGEKEAREKALTVDGLARDYLDLYAKPKKRSWAADERILTAYVIPAIGRMKVEEVHRRDVAQMLDPIAKRGPVMANRTLACVRKLFNWSVERGLLDASPCTHLKPPGKEHSRDRVLTDEEIRALWLGLDTARMDRTTAAALKLILVTGQRPGEVRGMRWEEVTGSTWTIPAEKSKNGLAHRVPLTALALELLPERATGDVFQAKGRTGPLGETALSHAVRKNGCLGLAPWTPHDLRRTAATRLGELGVSRVVTDKVLNHVDRTVGAIYDRHQYDGEKRQALAKWERRLRGIIAGELEGGNVVEIGAAR